MANTGQGRGKQLYTPSKYPSALASYSSSRDPEIKEALSLLVLEAPEAPATQGVSSSSNSRSVAAPAFSYYSPRIQKMIDSQKSSFGSFSDVEFGTESSTVHYSELEPMSHTKKVGKMNRKCFVELELRQDIRHRHLKLGLKPSEFENDKPFLRKMDHVVVGKKIGEGAQAEVYESDGGYVVKVFHEGFLLQDLRKQWPLGMLNAFDQSKRSENLSSLRAAFLLKDERFLDRFAFMMDRHWGDLRAFIDLRMVETGNQGPPFTAMETKSLLRHIAFNMWSLHDERPPILHRDLKASNVLVKDPYHPCRKPWDGNSGCVVTVVDYECSVGVVGTGFWRAPEILQQLKNGTSGSQLEFSKKSDVYGFGMLAYEVVTGGIPFEGHSAGDYDLVLNGTGQNYLLILIPV